MPSAASGWPGELVDLLNRSRSGDDGPVIDPTSVPEPGPAVVVPNLLGTMEGMGAGFAILQMPGSSDTAVVAVGEDYNALKLVSVGARQARLRDGRGLERTLWMGMDNNPVPPAAQPVASSPRGPYRTSRELREDSDHKSRWIRDILVQPVIRNGESVGVRITYKGDSNPFARLGIQSGDVVLSLNYIPAKAVEDLPDLLLELRNAQTLNFQLERNGQPVSLAVSLEP